MQKPLGPVHRFSLVGWIRLVKTPLYLRLFQHLRVTTPTQWTISLLLLHGWRPFQLKVTRRRR